MLMLEMCENGDLFSLIQRMGGIRDLGCLRQLFGEICSGVSALHELGVGHFDIKAENIIIGNDYKAKLCDFGAARNLTEVNYDVVGSDSYMAPEVRSGDGCSGCKPDIFSLGVLLFAMYYGKFPWDSTSGNDYYFNAFKENRCEFIV